jgi:hypothetical protein
MLQKEPRYKESSAPCPRCVFMLTAADCDLYYCRDAKRCMLILCNEKRDPEFSPRTNHSEIAYSDEEDSTFTKKSLVLLRVAEHLAEILGLKGPGPELEDDLEPDRRFQDGDSNKTS